jgi:DNA-nicking Smr family endonuclease
LAKPSANTLDGGWDRKLATGSVAPDLTIDLHGCSLDQAHDRLDHGLARAIAHGARVILLVTGKAPRAESSRLDRPLRGIIRALVHDWIAAGPHTGRIAAIRSAHPRHGGAGALYIILRRIRN